jgi:hypothetical protein
MLHGPDAMVGVYEYTCQGSPLRKFGAREFHYFSTKPDSEKSCEDLAGLYLPEASGQTT